MKPLKSFNRRNIWQLVLTIAFLFLQNCQTIEINSHRIMMSDVEGGESVLDQRLQTLDKISEKLSANKNQTITISKEELVDIQALLKLHKEQNKKKSEKKKKKANKTMKNSQKQNLYNKYGYDWEEPIQNWYEDSNGTKVYMNPENHKIYLNRTHLIVGAAQSEPIIIDVMFWKFRDILLPRIEGFLKGAHLYDWKGVPAEYWANTSNCFHSATNLTWITFPMWLQYVTADKMVWNKWMVTTEALQIFAIMLWVCNDMTKNMYVFVKHRISLHKNWLNFTYAFL